MNNQEKLTIRSSTSKVHRTNSQTILLYFLGFSVDIFSSSLVSFVFWIFVFVVVVVLFWLKIHILIGIRLSGRVSDKNPFTQLISGNKTPFFCLGIFKIPLLLRNRYIFLWQSLEILNVFNALTLKQVFWTTKLYLKDLEHNFLLENVTI